MDEMLQGEDVGAASAAAGTYGLRASAASIESSFRLPESAQRPGRAMDAKELLHAMDALRAIEDISYILGHVTSMRDRLEASFLSGASPSQADTALAADSVRWFRNASIVASSSRPSRVNHREARLGNYSLDAQSIGQAAPEATQWVRESTRQVEQARVARLNVERAESAVSDHAINAGTLSCTWPEFRAMATEFFHEIGRLEEDEAESAWKCLSLSYLGLKGDEVARFQAEHLFSLAKNKYVEFQTNLVQSDQELQRQTA